MDVREMVARILKEEKMSQRELAERMGVKSLSALSDKIRRSGGMSVDSFSEILDALGCEIIVRKKASADVEMKLK